jgi:hypothetical protein
MGAEHGMSAVTKQPTCIHTAGILCLKQQNRVQQSLGVHHLLLLLLLIIIIIIIIIIKLPN